MFIGTTAAAQTSTGAATVEEIVVTGSYIAGTPEDAALPVDVLSNVTLEKQGSPTAVQLVKTLTASASGLGESNRYNGGAGTASINLRGFGASRTLTLMNGRRLSDSAQAAFQGGGADLNFIPTAAIGRIEILKDGAAATYGSEAIGGVVNFITRKDLDGFEVTADYSAVQDSDGEYRANLAYGWRGDSGNILLTAGFRHRSRVDAKDRDWAIQPFESVNYGGWSGNSNPGAYVANTPAGAFLFRDNGCAELGGVLTNTVGGLVVPANSLSPVSATSICRFQFTNYNDVVNEEDHFQLYGEVNYDITEDIRFHGEVAWNRNNTPDQRISPSNGNTQFPTPIGLGGTSGSTAVPGALNFFVRYNVPGNNPGLRDLSGQTPGSACTLSAAQCASIIAAGPLGVDISQTAFRFIGNAGHPTNPDKADHQQIQATAYRVSGGLAGTWNSIRWDTNLTYMKTEASTNIADLLVTRAQLALNGFGSRAGASDQCTTAERTLANAGNAAAGCYFFNPFSNSVAVSGTNGLTNPFYRGGANGAVINDPQLVEWLYGEYTNSATSEIFAAEAVLSGDAPFDLPGGTVQWALGTQYRWNRDTNTYGDFFNNQVNPCVDSIDDDTPVCGAPAGPLIFFGSNANADASQDVISLFGELRLPILENLEVTLAGRSEKFSNGLSTNNPKIAVKWQALDWLAFRGSAGTTFRAPTATQINPGCAVGVANLGGQYRAVQTCGNPALEPETADAYNVGFMVQKSGFNLTVDYFLFKFEGELTTEGSSNLFAAMFTPNHCGDPAYAALQARFTFSGGVCSAANTLRVDTFTVNGPPTQTSGYDVRASYDWDGWFDAAYQVGVEGTYLKEYARGAFTLFGASNITFAAPFDRAGTHDLQSAFFSYPQARANLWLNVRKDAVNVRWQTRYAEGTIAAINTANDQIVPSTTAPGYVAGTIGKLDDFWQHDITIQAELPWETTLTFSVQNILDTDPPDAPSNYNYDYTTGNPLGRVFQLGVKKKF
ncbi:TonB-dependent receptor domain-containing protein [Phenylobacterium sp.]|uniref:TonB-dependent receptor domain-containing protein n=1 Tax=Phenylobacterium sp. TaxID=1871053 RepID=UPI0027356F36|nr:TonB-dependent receptor [Phenylobacterium sp.]MDP3855685.1 TonB-dependent receptor [Phenylobacterium sp.]